MATIAADSVPRMRRLKTVCLLALIGMASKAGSIDCIGLTACIDRQLVRIESFHMSQSRAMTRFAGVVVMGILRKRVSLRFVTNGASG